MLSPRVRSVGLALILVATLGACRANIGEGPLGQYNPAARRKVDEEFAKPPREASGSSTTIEARSVQFTPNPNTIPVGTTISFVNADSFPHNVTSGKRGVAASKQGAPDGRFQKELTGVGISLEYTFIDPGTYDYYCNLYRDMNGQVIVR